MIGRREHVETAPVDRISMESFTLPILVEHTGARGFGGRESCALLVVIGVPAGDFLGREGNVEIAIEVGVERRHPRECPPHTFLEGLELAQRRRKTAIIVTSRWLR